MKCREISTKSETSLRFFELVKMCVLAWGREQSNSHKQDNFLVYNRHKNLVYTYLSESMLRYVSTFVILSFKNSSSVEGASFLK